MSGLQTLPGLQAIVAHADGLHSPAMQRSPCGQVTAAHEALQAPSAHISPAAQVTPAHGSALQTPGAPRQSSPDGQPVE